MPETAQFPTRVDKGWGYEIWFANDREKNYCGKELVFNPSRQCSFHYHLVKDEVFYLVSGLLLVEFSFDDDPPAESDVEHRRLLSPCDRLHIPTGMRHRMTSFDKLSRLIEVSTFHDDEDVVRLIRGD